MRPLRARGYVAQVARGEALELEVADRTLRVTSPDKVFFPERGETKADRKVPRC